MYTQPELNEFVQLCYAIALPTIRKKIALGKINLDVMGLKEKDVVQDCLADLFRREESTVFPEINRFFECKATNLDEISDERMLMLLRQLVLGKCNNNIIRLYAETDPALGKIFRNITLAIERTKLFEKCTRFGEAYLAPHAMDLLPHLPPVSMESVREQFSRMVCISDTVPQMMQKLHAVLSEQCNYQRLVPLVGLALMFKETYLLGLEEPSTATVEQGEADDIPTIVADVCNEVEGEMHPTYVKTGKRTPEEFDAHMRALKELLLHTFVHDDADGLSYFDHLKRQIPALTKATYSRQHRTAFEYMAKIAKERVRKELRNM